MASWRLVILLILLSPIWIPAALIMGVCCGLVCVLSWLQLPTLINVALLLLLSVLMIPTYPIVLLTSGAFGHLFRERITLTDGGITIKRLMKTRLFSWQEIAEIVEVFQPPMNYFKFVLHSGEEFVLSQFAEIGPVIQDAPNHGISVQLLSKK